MMRNLALIFMLAIFVVSCGDKKESNSASTQTKTTEQKASKPKEPKYDKVDGVAVDMNNKGVGPVKSVTIGADIDQDLVAQGKEVYDYNCLACHKTDRKFVGPAPKGILERRAPEWIMNMILNPEVMVKEDPIAKQLLLEYNGSPMANQGMTEEQARAILEYFRTL